MPQLTRFPALPRGDEVVATDALIRVLTAIPEEGEPYKVLRQRLKKAGLWNRDRLQVLLDLFRLAWGDTVVPSPITRSLAEADGLDGARAVLCERLWAVNPLLFKAALERIEERVHSPTELFKYIDSFAYPGARISGPEVQHWIRLAQGLEIFKMVGIRLGLDARGQALLERAHQLDVEEFLEEDEPEPPIEQPQSQGTPTPEKSAAEQNAPGQTAQPAPSPTAPTPGYAQPQTAPAQTARPATAGMTIPLSIRLPSDLSNPTQTGSPVRVDRFQGQHPMPEAMLETTSTRLGAWWAEQPSAPPPLSAEAFGLQTETWMEDAQGALFRLSVVTALVFRLNRPLEGVQAAWRQLDEAGVIDDLYLGTVPDQVPTAVDPQALMLASLVARRLAEWPDLAHSLESHKTAEEALKTLAQALGRGLFTVELFWLIGQLGRLAGLGLSGLSTLTALPVRPVRDTLFRLGFLDAPWADDIDALALAAGAARRAVPGSAPADQVILAFTQAAGCAYQCPHRRQCRLPCRERADRG